MPEAESDPARRPKAAARVTRHLRLLCALGLIYRVGRTYYYRPTPKGYAVRSNRSQVPPDRSGSSGGLKA
jgi:hypothetical protein